MTVLWTLTKCLEKSLMGTMQECSVKFWTSFDLWVKRRPYKTASVRPLTSHITSRLSKTSKTFWGSKVELISDVLLYTPTHGLSSVGLPEEKLTYQIYVNAGYHLEHLTRAIGSRDRWQERVKRIWVVNTPWWWWKWCYEFWFLVFEIFIICFFEEISIF